MMATGHVRRRGFGLGRAAMAVLIAGLLAGHGPDASAGSWSAPQRIVAEAHARSEGVQLAVAPAGAATVLGMRYHEGSPSIQAVRRRRDGSWVAQRLSRIGSVFSPAVAVDGDGVVTAVWIAGESRSEVTVRRRRPGGRWTKATVLSSAVPTASDTRVAADADGNVLIVWTRSVDGVRRVEAVYKPAGRRWSRPVRISRPGVHANRPEITIDPHGRASAIWRAWRDGGDVLDFARRRSDGRWTKPVEVAGQRLAVNEIALGADRSGRVTAAWGRKLPSGAFVVETATRPRGGPWGPTRRLSPRDGRAGNARVAVAPDGSTALVWTEYPNDVPVLRVVRRTSDGRWRRTRTLSTAGHVPAYSQVVIDRWGTITVVWQDIFEQRSVVMAATQARGGEWVTSGAALMVEGLEASYPVVGFDRKGRTTVVWSADRASDTYTWWYAATRP
jgi:hypothetical protein